jgi:hypothetical protein
LLQVRSRADFRKAGRNKRVVTHHL